MCTVVRVEDRVKLCVQYNVGKWVCEEEQRRTGYTGEEDGICVMKYFAKKYEKGMQAV